MEKAQGFVENGNVTVTVGGVSATQKFMGSFVQAQVTVYNAGTLTLSTIYSDNSSTAKANPFTSSTTGYFFFYAANGRYDVTFSGGGLSAPLTFGDVLLADPFASGGAVISFNGRTGAVTPAANDYTLAQISGFPASSSELQFFRRKANQGATAVYEFATEPIVVSTSYNFTQVAPPENISPTLRTMTLAPVPLGINAADTFHYVGIYNNAGTWQENVLINGGSAVSGATTGTITVASIVGTYATGAYKIGSVMAGVPEALSILGTSPGTVFVPAGIHAAYGTARIQYTKQGIIGAGQGTVINKLSATGNLLEIQGSGFIYYNYIWNLTAETDAAVTPTAGAFIFTDTTAINGTLRNIFIQKCQDGLRHFGQNWTGGDISINDCTATGNTFFLRGGIWSNLQAVQNAGDGVVGGAGLRIGYTGGSCDGLQISGLFLEGQFNYGIYSIPTAASGESNLDVNISNIEIDLFLISAIYITGTGNNNLWTLDNLHVGNQTPDASNSHAVRIDGTAHHIVFSGGRVFNNQKRAFSVESAAAASDIIISNFEILNNSLASGGTHSAIYGASSVGLQITGNNIGAYTGGIATHKYCVELDTVATNLILTGNILRNFVTAAILYPATFTTSLATVNIGAPFLTNSINYLTEAGGNNAITGTLNGIALASGLIVWVKLAHSLQAGANTFALNGGAAVGIKSSRNPANNIATAYAATGTVVLLYDSTGPYWLDLSQ